MRKFILTEQHYDMAPGTELEFVKQIMPGQNEIGFAKMIGRHTDGALREVPGYKVVAHRDNDVFPTEDSL